MVSDASHYSVGSDSLTLKILPGCGYVPRDFVFMCALFIGKENRIQEGAPCVTQVLLLLLPLMLGWALISSLKMNNGRGRREGSWMTSSVRSLNLILKIYENTTHQEPYVGSLQTDRLLMHE